MEIHEVVRLLRGGTSDRDIVKLVGVNRRTVARYRQWAGQQGYLEGALPTTAEIERRLSATCPGTLPPQQISSVERYREQIVGYRTRGMEAAAIRVRLEEEHGHPVSYSAVWRLVRRLAPARVDAFVRVEVEPGAEAQVDFGYAGHTIDPATGRERKTWVFVMVLSWSRHLYAELVYSQTIETWLLCHRHAFEFFGGVPGRVVLDNLRAGVARASATEPMAQRTYRECATHYGFLIDPNPPESPRLKGKVEQGGVHFVARNFLAGREPTPIDSLNQKLQTWCATTAARRVHGTTKERPCARFDDVERAALQPLPAEPYDMAIWKAVTLYRDCYVTFAQSYYSAPYRLVGQPLWVRAGARTVQIITTRHEVVAIHDRATKPGERQTILAHLPPRKIHGLVASRQTCRVQATAMGLATTAVVERYLSHRPEDRLKVAQRILALAATAGPDRLERACARALHFGTPDYASIKRILAAGLDGAPLAPPPPSPPTTGLTFVRHASEFVAGLLAAAR